MDLNQLSARINEAALNVYRELGPGLLERVYRTCLVLELAEMGLNTRLDVPLPIRYREKILHEQGLQVDLLVEDTVIVSLISAEIVPDLTKKQLLTYLCLAGKPLGLLINFLETVHVTTFSGKFPQHARADFTPAPGIGNYKPLKFGAEIN
ncbi:MAG: GxxExxY protein [Desulfobacteraceae bacterium]|nr:MAG: GxxExxY protein [Desulfobacteraceae bacterium]